MSNELESKKRASQNVWDASPVGTTYENRIYN